MKSLISCCLILSLAAFPSTVLADKGDHKHYKHHHKRHHKHKHHKHHHHKHHYHEHHHHDHHRDVVVVEEHKHYHESKLPEIATFAVIAGVTYAIINNTFYKKSGDGYRVVDKPSYR